MVFKKILENHRKAFKRFCIQHKQHQQHHPNQQGEESLKISKETWEHHVAGSGEQAQVPLLIGSNGDETTLFFPLFQAPITEFNDSYDHPLD